MQLSAKKDVPCITVHNLHYILPVRAHAGVQTYIRKTRFEYVCTELYMSAFHWSSLASSPLLSLSPSSLSASTCCGRFVSESGGASNLADIDNGNDNVGR